MAGFEPPAPGAPEGPPRPDPRPVSRSARLPRLLLLGGEGGYSGVPRYLELLCRALAGHAEVTVLSDANHGGYDFAARPTTTDPATAARPPTGAAAEPSGGAADPQGAAAHPALRHRVLRGLQTSARPDRLWRALRGLGRRIEAEAPDLVWAHARMAVLVLRLWALWRHWRGRPVPPFAITLHGLPFGPGHRRLPAALARRLERVFLRHLPPHQLHFLSTAAAQTYVAALGGPAALARHRLHVLGNCSHLRPPPPAPPAPQPTLVMTGRTGWQKNPLAAARILAALPPGWRLLLCGAGTERPGFQRRFRAAFRTAQPALLERAGQAPTPPALQFHGPLADPAALLVSADLFLLTSRYEGMPIAALEAFEAGLPLLLPQIPEMAEILAAHPLAEAAPIGDPVAAAAAIGALVGRYRADPAAQNARIRAAWAVHFSFSAWAPGARGLLQALLAGRQPQGEPVPKPGAETGSEPGPLRAGVGRAPAAPPPASPPPPALPAALPRAQPPDPQAAPLNPRGGARGG